MHTDRLSYVDSAELLACLFQGLNRLRCSRGWFSDALLDGARRAREGTECFQVLSDSIIRRDADPASEIVDKRLRAGDTIIALEAETVENADGNDILRVHV